MIKHTLIFSDITPLTRELVRKKEKYHLFILGKVSSLSEEDYFKSIDDYVLRILIYKGGIVLERIRRVGDSGNNDVIISETFNFDEVPDEWYLERNLGVNGKKEFSHPVLLAKYKKFIEEFKGE
jgi:predicted HAD superfamily phosphohydrolase